MKLVEYKLEKIGEGCDIFAFLPLGTYPGHTVVVKKDDPDYSGAYRVMEKSYGDDAIIINQEDII